MSRYSPVRNPLPNDRKRVILAFADQTWREQRRLTKEALDLLWLLNPQRQVQLFMIELDAYTHPWKYEHRAKEMEKPRGTLIEFKEFAKLWKACQ